MKDPAEMMVRTSGPSWKDLKRDVHNLAVAAGFRGVRLGRYRRDDCLAELGLRLATQIGDAQRKYADGTKIRSLTLVAGVNLVISIIGRETK